jgi:hypothetical protein
VTEARRRRAIVRGSVLAMADAMTMIREAGGRMRVGLILGAIVVGAAAYGVVSDGAAASGVANPPPALASRETSAHEMPIMESDTLPPGHPPIGGTSAVSRAETSVTLAGKVVEVVPAGRYSYLRFSTPSGDTWAAVEGAVSVGAHVEIVNATAMDGFTSPTLGRKFDHILFGVARPVAQ